MILPTLEAFPELFDVFLKLFILVVFGSIFCLLYWFIRSRLHVNVECWFCTSKSRVKFIDKNCWSCNQCQQYNGFNPDGSYNKLVEEQSTYNARSYCQKLPTTKYESHRLCDQCNANQGIKVKLLSEFVPINEEYFEQEVMEFSKNLDGLYKLCLDCEILIAKVLDKPSNSPNNKFKKLTNDSFDSTSRAVFDTPCDDLKTIVLRFLVSLVLILLLFNLFCISFHSFIFLTHDSIFKNILSSDFVEIYEDYNVYLITFGFVLSSTQFYLETKNNLVEFFQLILWISLMINNLNYNSFSMNYDNLVVLHQRIYIILMVTSILKLCYNLWILIDYLKSRKHSYHVSSDKVSSRGSRQVKKANEAIRTIGKQIQELSLSSPSGVENSVKHNFAGVKSNEPVKPVLSYQSIYHQTPVFGQQNFAYFYNFSNSKFYSNTFASEWNNNSKLMHLKCDPVYDSKSNEWHVPRENVEPQTTARSVTFSNVFHLFSLILTLVILFFIIIILSMPISVSFKNDFNMFNINISFVNPNINE